MTEILSAASQFLSTIGIHVTETDDPMLDRFIPGIEIRRNCSIAVNPATLQNHADLLHEAAHLAIVPQPYRDLVHGDVDEILSDLMDDWFNRHGIMEPVNSHLEIPFARALLQAGELEAIAWSYAAAYECDMDPLDVFRVGYGGGGRAVHRQLAAGQHPGINGLVHAGMTKRALYPAMIDWTQTATMPDFARTDTRPI